MLNDPYSKKMKSTQVVSHRALWGKKIFPVLPHSHLASQGVDNRLNTLCSCPKWWLDSQGHYRVQGTALLLPWSPKGNGQSVPKSSLGYRNMCRKKAKYSPLWSKFLRLIPSPFRTFSPSYKKWSWSHTPKYIHSALQLFQNTFMLQEY